MPELCVPFGLLGCVAGFLAVTTLANPMVELTVLRVPWMGALSTAAVGTVTGAYLRRRCLAEGSMATTSARWVYLLGALMLADMVSGAMAGLSGTLVSYGLLLGACIYGMVAGVAWGLAFTPVCAWVLAAARRAARGRHGSIVAGSDGRAVWGISQAGRTRSHE